MVKMVDTSAAVLPTFMKSYSESLNKNGYDKFLF